MRELPPQPGARDERAGGTGTDAEMGPAPYVPYWLRGSDDADRWCWLCAGEGGCVTPAECFPEPRGQLALW